MGIIMIIMHFINEDMDEKFIELLVGGTGTHVKNSRLQNACSQHYKKYCY